MVNGLKYTPCGGYIVYPLGSMVVVKNLATDTQCFLEGHNNTVSAIAISPDGKILASGEVGITPSTKVGGKKKRRYGWMDEYIDTWMQEGKMSIIRIAVLHVCTHNVGKSICEKVGMYLLYYFIPSSAFLFFSSIVQ